MNRYTIDKLLKELIYIIVRTYLKFIFNKSLSNTNNINNLFLQDKSKYNTKRIQINCILFYKNIRHNRPKILKDTFNTNSEQP